MDLVLLRAFVTVAREGTLTRGAKRLNLSQPAVSLQIQNLQQALRLTLFCRTARGLKLTRDGMAMLPYAQRAIETAENVARAARALRNEVRGTLQIGTILDPPFLRLGGFLKSLVESYPQIETTLRHGMSGWVQDQIRAGQLAVGYYIDAIDQVPDMLFHSITLTTFQYLVLAPAGWGERIQQTAPNRHWRELAALPWIWTPASSAHNRLLSRIFGELGVMPLRVAEVDQEPSMLDLVKSGVGLSLVRNSVALAEAHANGLTIIEGVSVPAALTFICLAERREDPSIAAAFRLVEHQWAR
jgi:DNA-binding transcriptional LysR family regulator